MKRFFTLIYSVLISCFLIQCAKEGCTNSEAINYDLGAKKDDGSCEYQSSIFVGTYKVTGTKVDQTFNDTTIQNYQFILTQKEGNNIAISNLGNTALTISASIKNGQLKIPKQQPPSQLNNYEGSGVCIGNIINLQYTADFNNEFYNEVAVKQ
jgi:hypothetical protein